MASSDDHPSCPYLHTAQQDSWKHRKGTSRKSKQLEHSHELITFDISAGILISRRAKALSDNVQPLRCQHPCIQDDISTIEIRRSPKCQLIRNQAHTRMSEHSRPVAHQRVSIIEIRRTRKCQHNRVLSFSCGCISAENTASPRSKHLQIILGVSNHFPSSCLLLQLLCFSSINRTLFARMQEIESKNIACLKQPGVPLHLQ